MVERRPEEQSVSPVGQGAAGVQSCWGSSSHCDLEKLQAPESEDRLTTHEDRWK